MTNLKRAADIIGDYCCGYCEHYGAEQAVALYEAGPLMPDPPTPDGEGKNPVDKHWELPSQGSATA